MNIIENREYQSKIVEKTLALFDSGKDSIMIESPVGSGKTIMGLMVIRELAKSHPGGMTVNWVAHRHHLLKQVDAANREFFGLDLNLVSMFDKNPPSADVIVLDEAHHDATVSSANIFAKACNRLTLGLSATPLRTDKMKLSFQSTVRECGIARLINDDYLSPFVQFVIPQWTPEAVADVYLNDPEGWGKSLVFFHTIKECYEFQALLNQGDFVCDVITGDTDKDNQIIAFETGATQVVANVQVLNEGFDLPDLQSVFVRDAGRLQTIQMGGRGLRKAPGKAQCNVIQSRQTRYSFSKLARPVDTLMLSEGVWLSTGGNSRRVEEALKETAKRIAMRGEIKLPSFSNKRKGELKALLSRHSREWQAALQFLTNPKDQEAYLELVAKKRNIRTVLELAVCWSDHFGNAEKAREAMGLAEDCAITAHDWYHCALAWETHFQNHLEALRCIETALKKSVARNRKAQYLALKARATATVVP